jgi:energy-coupling factor transporter transmembrane protein EcfT
VRRPIVFIFLSYVFGIVIQHFILQDGFSLIIFASLIVAVSIIVRLLKFKINQSSIAVLFLLINLFGCLSYYVAENSQDPIKGVNKSIILCFGIEIGFLINQCEY